MKVLITATSFSEVTREPEDRLREAYAYFAGHTAQMHGWCGEGEAWTWPEQLPKGSRVVLAAGGAETKEDAIALAEKISAALGRSG